MTASEPRTVLIIQNDAHEGPGQLATLLKDRRFKERRVLGYDIDYAELDTNHYAGLVVLGGAQGVYEADTYPYLIDEVGLCRAFIGADKPVAGFCLGAQLLAHALGGEVVPGGHKEIGWHDLTLSEAGEEDPLLRGHPKTLLSFHFHGDIIRSAPGCENLAYSQLTHCQFFRHGAKAYGFQYHAEIDRAALESMCRANASYLAANGFDAEKIIAESEALLSGFESHCRNVLNRWIDLL